MAQKKTSGSGQTSQPGGEKKKFGRRGDGLGTGPVGQGPRGDAKKPSGKDQEKGILSDLLTGGSSGSSSSSTLSEISSLSEASSLSSISWVSISLPAEYLRKSCHVSFAFR